MSIDKINANLIERMPVELLDEPLEYIFADHFRQRFVCSLVRQIAEGRQVTGSEAAELGHFVVRDLPLHHADEEQDLFPALLKSARPEDDIKQTIARLNDDHTVSHAESARVRTILSDFADGAPKRSQNAIRLLKLYAQSENKHLAIENSVILPIARVRLSKRQLKEMSNSMKSRRNEIAS
jgi:hemerythrin-like domain-containing protein